MSAHPATALARPIDLVHLSRQTCGDRDLEREVLGLFRDQCARHLATIAAIGRPDAAANAAHTLKGAALGVGAFAVASAAARIEENPADIARAIAGLAAAVAEARAVIDRLIAD